MENAEHSFVVVAYGDSPYLAECLDSLQAQTSQSSVVICTSTPSSLLHDAARSYDAPLLINSHRGGMADDWTFAYQTATTPYVTLAHQDDRYAPEYSATMLTVMKEHADALVGFSDYAEIIADRVYAQRLNLWVKRLLLRAAFGFSSAVRSTRGKLRTCCMGCPICCPSVTFHKPRIGDFAFDPSYRFVTDWEAWLRLARRDGSFAYVNKRLVEHRLHADSETTRRTDSPDRAAEELEMLTRCWPMPIARTIALAYRLGHRSNRAARRA